MTEDEMAWWHHRLDGHEFEWTLGVSDGQGGLGCCDSWGHRVGHNWVTELNWTVCVYVYIYEKYKVYFVNISIYKISYVNFHRYALHNSQKWKQFKCSRSDEWIANDIKLSNNLKNEVLIHAVAWMNFENSMLSERGPLQKSTYWILSW